MASAKKCDRCGCYYDHNREYKTKRNHAAINRVDLMDIENGYDRYDLCDQCISELLKFMAMEVE